MPWLKYGMLTHTLWRQKLITARFRTLSDTTKSGQLLFPEFALAMYLCNLKLNGKELPTSLPEKVKNEVSSMVDIISFGVPEDKPLPRIQSNAPDFFDSRQSNRSPPVIQQPQPQQSNTSLLASLQPQPTGLMQQATGYPMQMQMGLGAQPTGQMIQGQQSSLSMQPTGMQGMMSQASGYTGPRPPMPPMPTGYGAAPIAPLNSQPTGIPGQWGLVNTPASGLPNIDALHRQMMPQAGRDGGFTTTGLSGNATIPWAVTKDEKKIYDDIFKAWDGFGKGYIGGDQAIEIMGQSGLPKSDLERIWTLSDPTNRGRLNLDEFAVAMHLIYRSLNGYPIPNRLPPELTPPSTRNLNDSIGTVKSLLQRDAEQRKTTGAFLQPQKTGVSYLKTHSFGQSSPVGSSRADATIFKNNDSTVGYKSSARRRLGAGGRSPSPAMPGSPSSDQSDEISNDQLRKLIKEKQILLDAIDFGDENAAEEEEALDRRDRRDAEDLYRRIRRVQEDIDNHPNVSSSGANVSDAEKRALGRQLQTLNDRLPELASQVRKCERAIADAQMELFRLRDAKANPGSAQIVGTGPGGAVTEADRVKARARALMEQRSAALRGKPITASGNDSGAAAQRLEAESSRVREERERNERMVHDVEESVTSFGKTLQDGIKEGALSSSAEHEQRRWEDALGVEDEVRDFIYDLQRQSQSNRSRSSGYVMTQPLSQFY
jgi:actin cytoskeleton-regulatory complex protein PAN1